MFTFRFEGKTLPCVLATMFSIFSAAATMFLPDLFLTSSITTWLPYSLAKVVLSFSLKLTVATSLRYTIFPFSDLTTKFSSSFGLSISPKILMVLRCPLALKLPADMVVLPLEMAPCMSVKLTEDAIIL